ncbi:MAG: hypothetical protein FWB74_05120 [Defluviitaleaceae bacterium]|nr:hypothetical protein [Defluviitaleaceae bacterium]
MEILIVISLGFSVIGMWILYAVIKAAVREGILEADRRRFGSNLQHPDPNSRTIFCRNCSYEYHRDCECCPICNVKKPNKEEK